MATKKTKNVEEIIEVVANTEETKEVVKKAKKPAMQTSLFVQFAGNEIKVDEKAIVAAVKKAWTSAGNKVGDIKTIELYVKPEDDAVYYVINKTESGKVEF
jgi:hypothetical protein